MPEMESELGHVYSHNVYTGMLCFYSEKWICFSQNLVCFFGKFTANYISIDPLSKYSAQPPCLVVERDK